MKRWTSAALALCLLLCALPARAAYDPEINYMSLMISAAQSGDTESGRLAQRLRDEKIDALGLDYRKVAYDDLSLLSRLIQSEAGSAWLGTRWKMAVGEVVLNRMASPEFPDTLSEVIFQPGQYTGAVNLSVPSYDSVIAAQKLLEGERVLDNPAVVFPSNGRQGSGVYMELSDAYLGTTYFCLSSRMELYTG